MRFLVAWLLSETACALRKRGSHGRIQATTAVDASGQWTAKVTSGWFNSVSVSFALPGGDDEEEVYQFDCHTIRPGSIASDAGLEVIEGKSGSAELTAVRQSSGVISGTIFDPKSGLVHQFSGKEGDELRFRSTSSGDTSGEEEPLTIGDAGVKRILLPSNSTKAQSTPQIDIMVFWTRDAECDYQGLPLGCTLTPDTYADMLALVELSVVETNQAFVNSAINARMRLVHHYRTEVQEERGSYGAHLSHLYYNGDGKWDWVHDERIQYGADLVSMWVHDTSGCGIALLGPDYESAFSVLNPRCIARGALTFTHEIGHNLGCQHDRGTMGSCSSSGYNYGYRDPECAFITMMAYGCRTDQCDNITPVGESAGRLKHFSNPDIMYIGKTTGASNANNARVINENAAMVAAFTAEPCPVGTVGPSQSGDCFCLDGAICYEDEVRGCTWSLTDIIGQKSEASFLQTCSGCICLADGTTPQPTTAPPTPAPTPPPTTPASTPTLGCPQCQAACTDFCNENSFGTPDSQCWGSPRYSFCKCSGTYYALPGCPCLAESCSVIPTEAPTPDSVG